MSTYVFFNVPAYGHIDPTLPIVAELCRRGYKVYYFTGEPFADAIQEAGGIPVIVSGTLRNQDNRPPGDKELRTISFRPFHSPRQQQQSIEILTDPNIKLLAHSSQQALGGC